MLPIHLVEAVRDLTIDINDSDDLITESYRHDDLSNTKLDDSDGTYKSSRCLFSRVCFRVARDMVLEIVYVHDQLRRAGLSCLATYPSSDAYRLTRYFPMERTENQLSTIPLVEQVETGPIHSARRRR